jgi:hypothetical protein
MPTAVEQILWAAVPNGVASGGSQLNLSVRVSPTLTGGTGFLNSSTHFVNWPTSVLNSSGSPGVPFPMHVVFTDGASPANTIGGANVAIDTSKLNPALWTALFGDGSTVTYTPPDTGEPYDNVPIVSYPSDLVASWLRDTYTSLATGSPTSHPSTSTLGPVYGPVGAVGTGVGNVGGLDLLDRIWTRLSDERKSNPLGLPRNKNYNDWSLAANDNPQTWFAALRFYHMVHQDPTFANQPALTLTSSGLAAIDFHRALTFINQHRTLQRALGLVFDVVIPTANLPFLSSPPATGVFVQALLANVDGTTISGTTPIKPRTRCNATTTVFEAYPSTPQVVGRQLTLGDASSFAVYGIDVDGGGLHTTQFADNLVLAQTPQSGDTKSANGPAPDAPDSYAPPALRSNGLTVAVVQRGQQFADALKRGGDLWSSLPSNSGSGKVPDLMAEDLVTGFVLDVWDQTGSAWHSTAMRDVSYSAGGITLNATQDEPGLDSPPRSQKDPTNSSQDQLNLPANLIRWTGWSNAAPRPGSPLAADGSSTVSTGPGSGPFNQMTITVLPSAGTLPRLRFGEQYALRARVVDIANNLLPITDASLAVVGDALNRVSPLSAYGRHDPLGSPDIYTFETNPFPGESAKRLVIRDIDPSVTSMRAFAPNRIAEAFAEVHGMFDTAASLGPPPVTLDGSSTTYDLITSRENQRYPGSMTPVGAQVWNPLSLTSPVPFLPDPLTRGGTLVVTLGPLTGNHYQFDFSPASGQKWPDYQPYGLVLKPGAAQSVTADPNARELTFKLTKGDTVDLQLSSYFDLTDLVYFGLTYWMRSFYGGPIPAALRDSILAGLTWAFTPWTAMELVFAVQKPLLIPKFANVGPLKQLGWTYAELFGDITYSPKSTARTDLFANWGEPVDNGPGTGDPQGPNTPNPALAPRTSTVFTIPSSHKQLDTEMDRFEGRHEFFDTKHRVVTYTGQATSSFTEHYQGTTTFAAPGPGTPTALSLPGHPGLGLEPGSVSVTDASGKTYAPGTDFTIDTTAGTLTFASGATGHPPPPGTMITVKFLPPVTVLSAPTTVDILSSARPLSADVEFVVPIFRWTKFLHKGSRTFSGRTPAALRVFVSRPWWSSGIGELLGVTTYPLAEDFYSASIGPPENLYVSDWGLDPVFSGRSLPSPHPRIESFPDRIATGHNVPIDEVAGINVNVAGHQVHYDKPRDLWYSDIVVDIGEAYTPMIRLALARYQPDSVPGAEISRIVLADVMSLDPARLVTVVRASPTLLTSVTLAGFSYGKDGDQNGTGPGVATLVVERRNPAIADQTLGWEPVAKPIYMRASTLKDGLTVWTARHVPIPAGGKHRLFLAQYEEVPTDRRRISPNIAFFPSDGLRLLYQDLIPL